MDSILSSNPNKTKSSGFRDILQSIPELDRKKTGNVNSKLGWSRKVESLVH
jgi:hypothetical protein